MYEKQRNEIILYNQTNKITDTTKLESDIVRSRKYMILYTQINEILELEDKVLISELKDQIKECLSTYHEELVVYNSSKEKDNNENLDQKKRIIMKTWKTLLMN